MPYRLHETYSVYKDQQLLADKNLDFFQNYLFSVIPPNLFDFFFFDGEEIGDFFATGNYSNYIKNAVLTLSGYDTFNIIQKFCDSYIGIGFVKALFDKRPFTTNGIQCMGAICRKVDFYFDIGLDIVGQERIVVDQLFDSCGIAVVFILKAEALGTMVCKILF